MEWAGVRTVMLGGKNEAMNTPRVVILPHYNECLRFNKKEHEVILGLAWGIRDRRVHALSYLWIRMG